MRRLDWRGAIHFIDAGTAETQCPIDRTALLARFHACEDGRMLSGAEAFAAMWRAIPLLRPMGIAGRNPIILAGLERVYRLFLHVRPKLQAMARKMENTA
jgi:predicted DCC family thiol-disulfide oxidoreductase YuxK